MRMSISFLAVLVALNATAQTQPPPGTHAVEILSAEQKDWTTVAQGRPGRTDTDCTTVGDKTSCSSDTYGYRPATTIHHTQVDILVRMPDGNEVKMQCHSPVVAFVVLWPVCFKPEPGAYQAEINKHNVLLLFRTQGRPDYNKDGTIKKPGKVKEEWVKFSFEEPDWSAAAPPVTEPPVKDSALSFFPGPSSLPPSPGANTPEGNALVAERYLARAPDGGVGLMRAIAQRMANAYPAAWNQISGELITKTLRAAGIGIDAQGLLAAIKEMRAAVQADDWAVVGGAVVKIVGAPKVEQESERSAAKDLPKRINEQKSDSKELGESDSALEANTPEGNSILAERYLARTPDGGVGLMRAIAQRMARDYPEALNQISTELLNSTLNAAGIGTDSQGLFAAIREMRAAIQANDAGALSKAAGKLMGAPKAE